ncbi:MAG: acetylxylan esterase [Verrucomicrobiae bacterium]|nr:acetylxylan esterase [Verrucomicrobiae bacterium]
MAGAGSPAGQSPLTAADLRLTQYFEAEVAHLEAATARLLQSLGDWRELKPRLRQQAAAMLGLSPMPARGDLQPVITGVLEHEDIVVEKLHFQSLPRLYVTANLYRPKDISGRLPAVLYVCGHGPVVTNGVSYGNKVSYQHHGVWFARHGYVCLVMDTVQWGEILGVHHGTYRQEMWWWNARGYTPAGVETWNGLRALDYLCTRPEVDTNRVGVTGRSGGGAYSWFIAALDDRVKVVAPVAGITDLRNHVLTGCVEGHCDCMYLVNTYRWDYPLLAVLAAPRPLLLVNTDSDNIFPLDGVMRVDTYLRRFYSQLQRPGDYGLVIGPGPHKDTQDLQVPVFRWFNRHLKGEDPIIHVGAVKPFTPQQLKVFNDLPADAINTNIQEVFVPPAASSPPPANAAEWATCRQRWLSELQAQCFAGWPAEDQVRMVKVASAKQDGLQYEIYEITTQPHVVLRLYTLQRSSTRRPQQLRLWVRSGSLPAPRGGDTVAVAVRETLAAFAGGAEAVTPAPGEVWLSFYPRGTGEDIWSGDARKQTHLRRRFMLLGQTLDGMRVWDIRQMMKALNLNASWRGTPLKMESEGSMAANTLYAAALLPRAAVGRSVVLVLHQLPASHARGPDYLNVLKILDLPQALLLAASACEAVHVRTAQPAAFGWTLSAARSLGWDERLHIHDTESGAAAR